MIVNTRTIYRLTDDVQYAASDVDSMLEEVKTQTDKEYLTMIAADLQSTLSHLNELAEKLELDRAPIPA
jgi:hypothetical protein